jgi:hypothetical protein
MEFVAAITRSRPVSVHFSLHNPDDADGPVWIPRVLKPLGVMLKVEVRTDRGELVYENPTVRATWKLRPEDPASYQALEPGYTFGVVVTLADFQPEPGRFKVQLAYANEPYTGTSERKVGKLSYKVSLPLVIEAE